MIPRQITMSLDRQNRAYKTCQHGTAELFASSGQGLLIFDPLDNRNLALLVNYQKVSLLEGSQEVGMKWGLGRSTSFHTSMQHIGIQYVIVAKPKLTNVKRVENYSHTRKIIGSKTKVPKHGIDSGLECALEVFEQPRRTRGSKKTLYRICREWNNCPLLKHLLLLS